jgi:hypothetical protein
MFRAKYVIVKYDGAECPIVFSSLMHHTHMTARENCVGAGFCHVENDLYKCYGESTSLGIKSRGEQDSDLLNRLLGQKDG